jgi:hypothetical protein
LRTEGLFLHRGVGGIKTASKDLEVWNEFEQKMDLLQQTKPDCTAIAFDVL